MEPRVSIFMGAGGRRWLGIVRALLAFCVLSPLVHADVVPGENVNMVAGPVSGIDEPLFPIKGDPFLQRQNEPSCDVSTRNPLHIFCASNDYRTVDVAGLLEDNLVGDAWLGVYWSNNGGRTFRSSILPGFPLDPSPEGQASPLYGFQAGADAVIRAGTHGMFYFAGIAFDRDVGGQTANAPVAGGGGNGVVFLARYIDLNNSPSDQKPIKQIGQPVVIATGQPGRFLDKPWLVVDKPRGNEVCEISVDGVTQSIPSSHAYVAYAAFIEEPSDSTADDNSSDDDDSSNDGASASDDDSSSKDKSSSKDDRSSDDDDSSGDGVSNDPDDDTNAPVDKFSELYVVPVNMCGSEPGVPVKVSGPKAESLTNQGASLAVDPQTGNVVVVWRRFSTSSGQQDAIMMAVSDDQGLSWSPPKMIKVVPDMLRPGDMSVLGGTFDQGSTALSARTNAFPTVVVTDSRVAGKMGDIFVAWANRVERVPQSGWPRESRVVITRSGDAGDSWTDPFPIDDQPLIGHQFQPTMHYQNGLLSIAYLDLRETHTRGVYEIAVENDPGDPGTDGVHDTNDDGKIVTIAETREPMGERETVADCSEPACYRYPDERLAFTDYLIDAAPENPDPDYQPVFSEHLKRRHTLDLRILQFEPFIAPPPGGLGESVKITQFPFGLRQRNGEARLEQFQYTPPNFTLFAKGTKAFIGDYIHCGALNFVTDGYGDWQFNSDTDMRPTLHCAWTDNRNVRPGLHSSQPGAIGASHSTAHYTPPGPGCDAGYAGTRNQDVFNARITGGVYAGSFGNSRPLGYVTIDPDPENGVEEYETILQNRRYDMFVENMTNQTRHYRLFIENQPGPDPETDRASFTPRAVMASGSTSLTAPETTLDVSIGPLSSASRPVFASSAMTHAPIALRVSEIEYTGGPLVADGQSTRMMLNPDDTNPDPRFPDSNIPPTVPYSPQLIEVLDIDVSTAVRNEVDFAKLRVQAPDPNNPDPTNPDPTNPDPTNPDPTNIVIEFPDPTNPDPTNPDPTNPDPTNPDPTNPDPTNPDPTNPDPTNPDPTNPDPTNATLYDVHANNPDIAETPIDDNMSIRDTYWDLRNRGNVSASYAIRLVTDADLPENVSLQLLVHRTDVTPALTQADSCELGMLRSAVTLVNIPDPALISADSLFEPNPANPDPRNATFSVGPGENVVMTLRVFNKDLASGVNFEPSEHITPAIVRPAGTYETLAGEVEVIETSHPLFLTDPALPAAYDDEAYTASIVAVGGQKPFSWAVSAGQIPAGLTLSNPPDGEATLSGIPTESGNFDFVLSVTDYNGRTTSQTFMLEVHPPPPPEIITTSPLPRGVMNEDYSTIIDTTGGKYPLSWSVTAGALPAGLSLQPPVDGQVEISGQPSQTEGASFTLMATDALGRQVSRDYEMVICFIEPPPQTDPLFCPLPPN